MKFDTPNRFEEISSKTLVIHGEEYMPIKPEGTRILVKRISDAELKTFKQAGHCANGLNVSKVSEKGLHRRNKARASAGFCSSRRRISGKNP